jgi:hypothetical protein
LSLDRLPTSVRTFSTLCLVALAMVGCGSAAPRDSAQDFKGEERAVAAAVEQLESAARSNKPATVCDKLLSDSLLETLEQQGTTCRTGVKEGFDDADSIDLTVEDVSISGDKATVKLVSGTGSDEKNDTLELERDGTDWKISQLLAR